MSRYSALTARPTRLMFAALLFAAAGVLTFPADAATPDTTAADHGGGAGMHAGMGGHGMGMHGGPRQIEHMLDSVNATADQRAQIKAIMQAAMADLKGQRESGKALHEQMLLAFAQPTVDARVVESLRAQQQVMHEAASKRMLQAKLEVSRVLTPEQRKQLADSMAKRHSMMERHRAERTTMVPATK